MRITMRATYDEVSWDSDEDDGFTDPHNPWGGLDVEIPPELCGEAFTAFVAENVDTVTFDSLSEAVHFVMDFPGGVWDYRESDSEMDYRTGVYRSVTLHVDNEAERVFKWADILERIQAARRAR